MDLLKYLIVGVGSILLGIVIAILARNVIAGIGATVLTFVGYFLVTLTDMVKPPTNTPESSQPNKES